MVINQGCFPWIFFSKLTLFVLWGGVGESGAEVQIHVPETLADGTLGLGRARETTRRFFLGASSWLSSLPWNCVNNMQCVKYLFFELPSLKLT